jgi:hypothetical protein
VRTAEGPVFPIRACVDYAATDEFLLYLHENFTRDDSFMAVFHIILRNNAMVFNSFLCEKVSGVCFLQEGIADVLLVSENLVDFAGKQIR